MSTTNDTKPIAAGDDIHFKIVYLVGGKSSSVPSRQTAFVASFWYGAKLQPLGTFGATANCTATPFEDLQCELGPMAVNETIELEFTVKAPEHALIPQALPFTYQIWDRESEVPPGQPHEWGDTRTWGALHVGYRSDGGGPGPPPPPPPGPALSFAFGVDPAVIYIPGQSLFWNVTIGIDPKSTTGAETAKMLWSAWSGGVVTTEDQRCTVSEAMTLRCLLGSIPIGGSTTVMLSITNPKSMAFPFGLPFAGGVWESGDKYGPCDDDEYWFCPRMTEFEGVESLQRGQQSQITVRPS